MVGAYWPKGNFTWGPNREKGDLIKGGGEIEDLMCILFYRISISSKGVLSTQ